MSTGKECRSKFEDFFKAFDSLQRGNMEQKLPSYDITKENVTVILTLKKTKASVRSPDVDTDLFSIITCFEVK